MYYEHVPRIAQPITLEAADRLELERWVAAHGTPQQVTQRCQIILAAADGCQDQEIAEDLQINFKTVALWRGRAQMPRWPVTSSTAATTTSTTSSQSRR